MAIDYGEKARSVASISDHPEYKGGKADEDSELFQGLSSKLPPMPGELGQIAKNMWCFVGKQLESAGIISSVDLSVLRVYCETYQHYVLAQRQVEELGEYQKTPNQYHQLAPWAVARERHANRLHKLEQKLFLTPHARKAITLENPNQGQLDLG